MKKVLPLLFLIFSFSKTHAQIGANTPCNIQNPISLNFPTQCGIQNAASPTSLSLNNTNYGSEPQSPFFIQCNPPINPVTDIWLKFFAPSNSVKINIDSSIISSNTINTPQLTIYQESQSCKQPKPIQCFSAVPNSKTLNTKITGLVKTVPYLIQISGANIADTGNFQLTITPFDSCTCMETGSINLSPLPAAGYYSPGQNVTVCFSVVGFNSSLGNGLHAIIPTLGSGWDINSISNIVSTPSIDQNGKWSFYNNITTPIGIKSGFFYEKNGDTNPTNNLGDYGNTNDLWIFCFDIKTKSPTNCTQEANLNITFDAYNDAITGSNANNGCKASNSFTTLAKLNCCNANATVTTTPADCNETCDGSAIINLNTSAQGPFKYEWFDSAGLLLQQTNGFSNLKTDTLKNACALKGEHTLIIHDSLGCTTYKTFQITYPLLQVIPQQQYYSCPRECLNTASITNLSTHNFTEVKWHNSLLNTTYYGNLALTDSICAGFYEVRIETQNGCSRDYEWFIFDSPPANPFFSYPKNTFCATESGILPDSISNPGGSFSSSPPGFVNPSTGALQISGANPGDTITITYITGGNKCPDTSYANIYISSPPPTPIGQNQYTTCLFDSLYMSVNQGPPLNQYEWYFQNDSTPIGIGKNIYYSFQSIGNFTVYVYPKTSTCRGYPLNINVTVNEGPADAGPDIEICPGNSSLLNATGGNNYLWIPSTFLSDDKSPNPTCTPDSSISYLLKVISQSTCPGYDTLNVTLLNPNDCINIKPVNAFSPNNDDINDFWFIKNIENIENQVSIYNRWGTLVWKTKNYNNTSNAFMGKDLNGEHLIATTYFYLIAINNIKYSGWLEITR